MCPLLGLLSCFNIDTLYHPHFIGEKTLADKLSFLRKSNSNKKCTQKAAFIQLHFSFQISGKMTIFNSNVYCLGKNVNDVNLQNFS